MRISDWSSDVCSSDLDAQASEFGVLHIGREVGDEAGHVALEKSERERAAAREIPFERRVIILRLDRLEVGVAAVRGADAIGIVGSRLRIVRAGRADRCRSEEHTSELQSLMRISYAVF